MQGAFEQNYHKKLQSRSVPTLHPDYFISNATIHIIYALTLKLGWGENILRKKFRGNFTFVFSKSVFIYFVNGKFLVSQNFVNKISAVSWSPLNLILRCHAHRCFCFCGVMHFVESVSCFAKSLLNLRMRNFMFGEILLLKCLRCLTHR